jgi:hypothetical protein
MPIANPSSGDRSGQEAIRSPAPDRCPEIADDLPGLDTGAHPKSPARRIQWQE